MGLLENKRVVVTGGSKGIGRAVVDLLVKHGARVAFCCRDARALDRLAKDYAGANILCRCCDVREHEQVISFLSDVQKAFDGIDVLINNAGIGRFNPVADFSFLDWHDVFRTNLDGPFYFCREFAESVQSKTGQERGYIVNIGSLCHRTYVPGNAAYSAAKAALRVFTDYLFEELREKGVFVSYLAIGSVRTSLSPRHRDNAAWKIAPEDVARFVFKLVEEYFLDPSYCMSYCELRVRTPLRVTANKD